MSSDCHENSSGVVPREKKKGDVQKLKKHTLAPPSLEKIPIKEHRKKKSKDDSSSSSTTTPVHSRTHTPVHSFDIPPPLTLVTPEISDDMVSPRSSNLLLIESDDSKPLKKEKKKKKTCIKKEGYLKKQGGSYKSWKTRLFVLENGKISYYATSKVYISLS